MKYRKLLDTTLVAAMLMAYVPGLADEMLPDLAALPALTVPADVNDDANDDDAFGR